MAGEWLKWSKGLTRKPEILKIAARLLIQPAHAAGVLMQLMEWLDESIGDADYDESGNAIVTLGALPTNFIDGIIGVQGLSESLAEVGWIRRDGDKLLFVNASRHNGKTAKARALTRERVVHHRKEEVKRSCNGETVTTSSLFSSDVLKDGGTGGNQAARPQRPSVDVWLTESKKRYPDWPERDARMAWEHYEKVGWRTSSNVTIKKWEMCIGTCYGFWQKRNGDTHSQLNLTADQLNARKA